MNYDSFEIDFSAQTCLVSAVSPGLFGHKTETETEQSLEELKELLKTLGNTSHDRVFVQKRQALDAGTLIGKGKLEEIAAYCKDLQIKTLVFDIELTASQARNISKLTGMDVFDRCHVILEIFAKHARTREAKIQIEISRLKYLLPRLSSLWNHFSRQKGGIGIRGGEGEQQIELDRRMIRQKLSRYETQLQEMIKSRNEQKKNRSKSTLTAALIGYTNAGKSSLLNQLCQEQVYSEDKLFATLDSTYRTLTPDTKPPLILVDTVGFISNLPNTLIEGFKTTLESALEADLLLIVSDVSSPHFQKHIEVTESVLRDLKVDQKDRLYIFNKSDLVEDELIMRAQIGQYKNHFVTSVHDKDRMAKLREYIIDHFLSQQDHYDLFLPYEQGHLHSKIKSQTNIINSVDHEQGIFYRIKVPESIFNRLGVKKFILSPAEAENIFS
jgi:GTP-binding protein HflX